MILHAGCLARMCAGRWRGVLLTGPSGAGKSDLALRLVERGWTLVADDRSSVWRSDGRLYARSPDALRGLIEARGLDVLAAPSRSFVRVVLLADCVAPGAALERIPEPEVSEAAGASLPRVRLRALEASAPAKLELAFARTVRAL